ncbi:C-GCAxxG-C-C family (seleno)protein [Clostridium senegalense]|uniref:Oxidoreductase n=1 Tax=Clostridium senegalense TaxID=1465809 RepID=A0A6M0H7G1_9CLOT|nr:C-GCAxxG-C-C family (seleno)protein [Clostridium senegalense]NEU05963.1 oxidoreductase [Clostridium senegalense]
MKKVLDFHKEGYNCSESIIKAINEENNLDIPVSIATPFGGGMSVGTTCGAITGAMMVLGATKGRENAKNPNEARKYGKLLMNKIKEEYGTFDCIELKRKGVSCDEIIEYAYDALKEIMDEK